MIKVTRDNTEYVVEISECDGQITLEFFPIGSNGRIWYEEAEWRWASSWEDAWDTLQLFAKGWRAEREERLRRLGYPV